MSGSTGVVTVNVHNAGTMPVTIGGIRVYGSGGSQLSCSWNNVGVSVPAGGSYGVVGQCSGLVSGDVYTVLVTLNSTNGSFVESTTATAS